MTVGASLRPVLSAVGLIFLAELVGILLLNDGSFQFSLDDPYIHLSLAENLASGHYGVNPGEAASPASSVLWPFLLIPFAQWSSAWMVMLAFNAACAMATVFLYWRVLDFGSGPAADFVRTTLLFAMVVIGNLVGLAFTGMEHSLQVLLCTAIIYGLLQEMQLGRPPSWLGWVLFAAPLVRFECLALVAPSLVYLALRGHWRVTLWVGAGISLSLGGFALWLDHLGLPWLPTSVLAKSMLETPELGDMFIKYLGYAFSEYSGWIFVAGLIPLAFAAVRARSKLAGVAAGMLVIHLFAGNYGWYDRYEVYARSVLFLVLFRVYGPAFIVILERLGRLRFVALTMGGVLLVAPFALWAMVSTPWAANDIYRQQYQLHRFVVDYWRRPVAINDLGWVSYLNENYVLDLWGLASNDNRLARFRKRPGWMAQAAVSHDVRLAMIYPQWFPDIPSDWHRLGTLVSDRSPIVTRYAEVAFYAIGRSCEATARALLGKFTPTLPDGVNFIPVPPSAALLSVEKCPPPAVRGTSEGSGL